MSLKFGPIFQNGFAVRDWQAAAEHWVNVMGVGPFFVMQQIEFEWCMQRVELILLERDDSRCVTLRANRFNPHIGWGLPNVNCSITMMAHSLPKLVQG